jgi:hypothetical protein
LLRRRIGRGVARPILVTADFDAKPAGNDIRIEFLAAKPKPN